MTTNIGHLESANIGTPKDDLVKQPRNSLQAKLDGFVGDRHRSVARETWKGDKQPEGTRRRNERQWSAMSVEELVGIEQEMDLKEPLTAASLGVNLCFKGLPNFSRLLKGTILKFPSGAELMVEEYNPPCIDMGRKIASLYTSKSGGPIADTAFPKAAKHRRGLVGVIEVAGIINVGDEVTVKPYQPPTWLARLASQETDK